MKTLSEAAIYHLNNRLNALHMSHMTSFQRRQLELETGELYNCSALYSCTRTTWGIFRSFSAISFESLCTYDLEIQPTLDPSVLIAAHHPISSRHWMISRISPFLNDITSSLKSEKSYMQRTENRIVASALSASPLAWVVTFSLSIGTSNDGLNWAINVPGTVSVED